MTDRSTCAVSGSDKRIWLIDAGTLVRMATRSAATTGDVIDDPISIVSPAAMPLTLIPIFIE